MATTPLIAPRLESPPPLPLLRRPRLTTLARTHAAIWWLHDAPDYAGLESAALELVALALPDLSMPEMRQTAAGIRLCYECYDAAQECVRDWDMASHKAADDLLRQAHRHVREVWRPGEDNLEEGYFAFYSHSMWLHAPGWRRPVHKLWRNPARLAGLWRYHTLAFGSEHKSAVYPAVKALFWAGLQGHDYKSREAAESWLEVYWSLLGEREIRHLFF